MAKIKPIAIDDPAWTHTTILSHLYWIDPFEPGAYHTVYGYPLDYPTLYVDGWQTMPSIELAILAAQAWASRPEMMADICIACRFLDYGPSLPRWNIDRGEPRVPRDVGLTDYAPRILPCFVQDMYDPPPPGYGQPP